MKDNPGIIVAYNGELIDSAKVEKMFHEFNELNAIEQRGFLLNCAKIKKTKDVEIKWLPDPKEYVIRK